MRISNRARFDVTGPSGSRWRAVNALWLIALIALPAGCKDEADVRRYRTPKEAINTAELPEQLMPDREPGTSVSTAEGPARPTWTAPPDWQEAPGGPMVAAAYVINADDEQARVTVVPLSGSAGGVVANVQRWARQLGLPPLDEDAVMQRLEPIVIDGREGWLVELTNGDQTDGADDGMSTMAAMVMQDEMSWFFKMTGPRDVVRAQGEPFRWWLTTIRWGGDGGNQAEPSS
jgi:hypothetical protein